jgi:hypothetical protein
MPISEEEFEDFNEESYAEEQKRLKEEQKREWRASQMTFKVCFKREERDNFNMIMERENFTKKEEFVRKIILDFIDTKLKFYKVQEEADNEFIEEYKKFRKWYQETLNEIKKKREEMINALPQDEGGSPFTAGELSRT